MSDSPPVKPKSKRGFASMSPERRKEIARKGGNSVPKEKRFFYQDRIAAQEAGALGGAKKKDKSTD